MLVRHAPTGATRSFSFPADEPLDEAGRAEAVSCGPGIAAASGIRAEAGVGVEILCSPSLRARQTVRAAGLGEPRIVAELAECDFGAWSGRKLGDLAVGDPQGVNAWMTDPDAAPHGGESLTALLARTGGWLDRQVELGGGAIAITHGGVIRALVVHALRAPVDAFWRIEAAPLAITELRCEHGRWTVCRMNCQQ